MRMSSQASHIHVSERCRYCSRVEMWVNLRAILVTSDRQSDNNPVSNWKTKMGNYICKERKHRFKRTDK